MRRLLLFGALLAMQGAAARKPAAPCDLPCMVEQGKYIVMLETPAGPRRFVFDTGASRTTVSERFCREAGLTSAGRNTLGDFEGYCQQIATARIPALTIGGTTFGNCPVDVLPDSSYVWCLGVDGIVGSDLLQHFVVRFSSDTILSLARDYRQFGDLDRRQALRLRRIDTRPFVSLHAGNGKQRLKLWALFDSGSSGFFDCRYHECLQLLDRGILRRMRRTSGHPGHMGWTNRSSVREAVRGTVPRLEVAGHILPEVPVRETYGSCNKLGSELLSRGEAVIDYPGRRFWLLPRTEQPAPADTPLRNISVAIEDGRLVVGLVWDEALADLVAPGDRFVRLGTLDVSEVDPCSVVRGELRADKSEITVERADGTRVVVPIKNL